MALGKYSRVDGRKSSSGYCSTVTIVVFVALCLVGVWMMTSTSVVPGQTTDVSQQNKNEEKTTVTEISAENKNDATSNEETNPASEDNGSNDEGKQKQFEDNPGDLPDDATKGDSNVNASQAEKTDAPEETEKTTEEKPEEKSEDEKKDNGDDLEDGEKNKVDEESKVENPESEAGENKENNLENEKSKEESGKTDGEKDGQTEEKVEKEDSSEKKDKSSEVFPSGAQSELTNESAAENGSFSTQAAESKNEKEVQKSSESDNQSKYSWKVCNTTAGPDYIPCLDNLQAIRKLSSTKHYEHRERHCPENPPTCLVPLPEGYQRSMEWPISREKVQHFIENVSLLDLYSSLLIGLCPFSQIWYHNVPHTKLAEVKGHQNWVKVSGEYLTFPGGGTQFKHGALHYIDFIQQVTLTTLTSHVHLHQPVGVSISNFVN